MLSDHGPNNTLTLFSNSTGGPLKLSIASVTQDKSTAGLDPLIQTTQLAQWFQDQLYFSRCQLCRLCAVAS